MKFFVKTFIRNGFLVICLGCGLIGCDSDYLNVKPDQSLLVPKTLTDFEALLDNSNTIMNRMPSLHQYADGDFYVTENGLRGVTASVRNSYLWADDIYIGGASGDWDGAYRQVFYCNIVLEGLANLDVNPADLGKYNEIKGSALFRRALAFYNLAQEFSQPYDSLTAASTAGIPLKLESDVTASYSRGTLQQTYEQVFNDIDQAQKLLPERPTVITRPSRHAALALLARIYLALEKYGLAEDHAAKALAIDNTLLDYRLLPAGSANPFPVPYVGKGNPEIIFASMMTTPLSTNTIYFADSVLFKSYHQSDLRRSIFFKGNGNYKGSYTGGFFCFGGLANDELYLILSECMARTGNLTGAMQTLNQMAVTRYKAEGFTPFEATSADQALRLILQERRKQLIARGVRWTDLRRLNKDSRFQIIINRTFQGKNYQLLPGGNRYTFPIPDDEIVSSGIAQNPR